MTKRSLSVGINAYVGAQLSGCVNDATDWVELLAGQGYDAKLLLDTAATKATVVEALAGLVAASRWGDRLVFTYSGHGTWLPDRDLDEADGRDEALCCYDFREGGLLLDDELQAIVGEARRGVGVLILSDSCHSGTVSRMVQTVGVGVPRYISPVDLIDLPPSRAERLEALPASKPRATSSLISGCGDLEYSYDAWFGERPNGAFTRAAIDTYRPGIKLGAWHKAIRAVLPSADYPQSPEVTSTTYRRYTAAL